MRSVLIVMALAGVASAGPASEAAVAITARGVWLGIPGGAPCFVPRVRAALAAARVEDELGRIASGRAVTIAAERGVIYQDVIVVMELASKVGLGEARLGAREDLTVDFDRAAREPRGHCSRPAPTPVQPPSPPRDPGLLPDVAALARLWAGVPLPPPPPPRELRKAPVVVVTRTELSLAGRVLGDVAALTAARGHIAALEEALRQQPDGRPTAIVQADAAVDAALIQRITATAAAAGFDDVLFAVKTP